jgi:CubicO group peptidase (beta-lactamase class C family)
MVEVFCQHRLAGAVIEQASEQTYSSYVNSEVFRPLGMTRTSLNEADAARFYETESGQLRAKYLNCQMWKVGGRQICKRHSWRLAKCPVSRFGNQICLSAPLIETSFAT